MQSDRYGGGCTTDQTTVQNLATAAITTMDPEIYVNIVNVGMEIWMAKVEQR